VAYAYTSQLWQAVGTSYEFARLNCMQPCQATVHTLQTPHTYKQLARTANPELQRKVPLC
jgi:hypothetical protein